MKLNFALLAAGGLLVATPAMAQVRYLDFEGIATYPTGQGTLIGNYYNGGAASNGAVGPNLGVQFTSSAVLLCLNTAGTTCSNTSKGGLGIATSRQYAMYFPTGNPVMNVAAGFDTGFSFAYSAPFTAGSSVNIWSGLNGTGTLLATTTLALTPSNCDSTLYGGAQFCPFVASGLTFAGTAQSVSFGGTVNTQVFDDFTFGSAVVGGGGAVPEPATWGMMVLGFGVAGVAMRRRVRASEVRFDARIKRISEGAAA